MTSPGRSTSAGRPADADPPGARPDGLDDLLAEPAPPTPGTGRTAERFERLAEVGRRSLTLARLYEGHTDALAILDEAGCSPPTPTGLLAVWASEGGPPVALGRTARGLRLDGAKPFCSAAGLATAALVTARDGDDDVLALVDLGAPGVEVGDAPWATEGMRGSATAPVTFVDVPVLGLVGPPGWYLARPGFWHGAVGVAACWHGGALGVLDALRRAAGDDPHGRAHLGEADAIVFGTGAALAVAAAEIDADPADRRAAHRRALRVRALVESGCRAVLDHAAVALGPRPLVSDPDHSARVADLAVYLRQHHGRRDLEELGALLVEDGRADGGGSRP